MSLLIANVFINMYKAKFLAKTLPCPFLSCIALNWDVIAGRKIRTSILPSDWQTPLAKHPLDRDHHQTMDLINKVGIVVQKYCRSLVPMNPIPAKYLLDLFKYRSGSLSYNCLPTHPMLQIMVQMMVQLMVVVSKWLTLVSSSEWSNGVSVSGG